MTFGGFRGVYRARKSEAVADLLVEAYGVERDPTMLLTRLPLIREALQEQDLCRATILALHARIAPPSGDAVAKLAKAEALAKYNFNPDEPRDRHTIQKIYTLWLRYIDEDGYDHELRPGIYTTRDNAQKALAFLSDKPGFCDHPDGFEISEGVIDKTYFAQGFLAKDGRGARDVELGREPSIREGGGPVERPG